jgi:hypothetical protein
MKDQDSIANEAANTTSGTSVPNVTGSDQSPRVEPIPAQELTADEETYYQESKQQIEQQFSSASISSAIARDGALLGPWSVWMATPARISLVTRVLGAGQRAAAEQAFTHGYEVAIRIAGLCLVAAALVAVFGLGDDHSRDPGTAVVNSASGTAPSPPSVTVARGGAGRATA